MGAVAFSVNGRRYSLACEDGEETRLSSLGERLDARVQQLANQFGQIGDQQLLLMASLTLMDEYDELAGNMEAKADALVSEIQADAEAEIAAAEKAQKAAVKTVNGMADRVERLLAKLG